MKKFLTIISGITLLSCSNPDNDIKIPEKITIAKLQSQKRHLIYNNSSGGQLISDTGFLDYGTVEFYSNNASDCGKIELNGDTQQLVIGTTIRFTSYRKIVKCE